MTKRITDPSNRPTMRDLATHVIPSVNTKWYDLGLQLLDPKYADGLNTIGVDTRNDVATCCRKMFNKWLNTDELASWDKLIKALRIVQLNKVASDIEQLLLQGVAIDAMGSVTTSNQQGSSRIATSESTSSQSATATQSISNVYDKEKPKMWDLIKIVIPKVKADWKHLAYSLDYDTVAIRAFEKDGHDSAQCCEILFEDWLSTQNGAYPKTWSTLLKRIERVERLFSTVDDIKRARASSA